MRLNIFAIGKMKTGPERQMLERYEKRIKTGVKPIGFQFGGIKEWPESRAASAKLRMAEESQKILQAAGEGNILIGLDERGEDLSSADLATLLQRQIETGKTELNFAIGGPDGHDEALRRHADKIIRFGRQTWPHQIARIMLAEQLYRAMMILANHPYHRV